MYTKPKKKTFHKYTHLLKREKGCLLEIKKQYIFHCGGFLRRLGVASIGARQHNTFFLFVFAFTSKHQNFFDLYLTTRYRFICHTNPRPCSQHTAPLFNTICNAFSYISVSFLSTIRYAEIITSS